MSSVDRLSMKATALWQAWVRVTGAPPPNMNALHMVLAQAEHETNAGSAWDNSGNWGACDLRALNAAEVASFAAGDLKIGMWLYPDGTWGAVHRQDSIGTLRGDSDPNVGAFRVWFAAFPTDTFGAGYMLHAGVRGARAVLDDPACTPTTYAQALYLEVCYFGGFHPTQAEAAAGMPHPRPCGKRTLPLNAAETRNVGDYAHAITELLPGITAALVGWVPPGEVAPEATTAGDKVYPGPPNGGIETAPCTDVGTDETKAKTT